MKTIFFTVLLAILTLLFGSCTKKSTPATIGGVWKFNYEYFSYDLTKSYAPNFFYNFKSNGTLVEYFAPSSTLFSVPFKLLSDSLMVWTFMGYSVGGGFIDTTYGYDTVSILNLTSNHLFLGIKGTHLNALNDTLHDVHYIDLSRIPF